MMYMSVVHGSSKKPSRPQTQLSIAASGLSPKSHQKRSAIRGPRPVASMRRQHTRRSLDAAQVLCQAARRRATNALNKPLHPTVRAAVEPAA